MRDRVVRDEIHRDILIPGHISRLIDTSEFQRLRSIQQLSTCHYVFPSATHTRFAHSLGAYHLACRLTSALQEVHPGVLDSDDAELVQIAALVHDIGHPPFSHLLESPQVYSTFKSHETWGRLMLASPTSEIGKVAREILGEERFERIFAIMDGESEHAGKPIPPFLKEIVSSQLDVDRMDYLVRDQRNTGAQIGGFDIDRVLRALRVNEDGHLHVKMWGLPAIEAYLVCRFHMYQQVYFHKVNMLTQTYLIRMLSRARQLAQSGDLDVSSKLSSMLLDEDLSVEGYASLNDSHVLVDLEDWANSPDELLSQNASRLLTRRDFHKALRIGGLTVGMVDELIPKLRAKMEELGFNPDIDLLVSSIAKRGYMPYEQGILMEDGRDVIEHSPLVQSICQPEPRALIFVPEQAREECEALVRDLIKPTQSSLNQFS